MLGVFVSEFLHGLLVAVTSAPPGILRRHIETLHEVVQPHPGTTLHSADGARFTGVVVVADSTPVMMICARRVALRETHRFGSTEHVPTFGDGYDN